MRYGPVLTFSLAIALSCNGSKSTYDDRPSPAEAPRSFPVSVPGRAAEPLVLYTPDALPPPGPTTAEVTGLALAGSEVYFVDSVEGVLRASLQDGSAVGLTGLDRPLALPTVAAKHLYLVGDNDLVSVPRRAGPLSVIRDRLANPRGLAIQAGYAYVTTGQWLGRGPGGPDGKIVRIALSDGARTDLATGLPGPISVAVDDDHAYWTCQGAVMRAPIAGGRPETLASFDDKYPWHIALDDEYVYTMVETGVGVDLYRLRKNDGTSLRLAHMKTMPASVAVADGAIHFVAESDQRNVGTLWRLEVRTARLITVATGLAASCCVAADDEHLAWTAGRDVFWMKHAEREVHRVLAR
ncbi:MAG: hypothetical protein JKY37_22040 [Nannocystaceae bacterium]|nr:hypothetical protein [Nannocystaceae bacterium]